MPNDYPRLQNAELDGKRVLLRAGFDVPIEDGVVADTSRIEAIVPTMKYILERGASLILLSHQGRPGGKVDLTFTQQPLVPVLEQLLHRPVQFAASCTGEQPHTMAMALKPGEILLLENLRFDPREKKGDESFAKELASLGSIYVNDAFTNCHRAHASMSVLPRLLPSYMGLQLETEIDHLSGIFDEPRRPLTLIIAGAKLETKVPVIRRFLGKGDHILLGGAIANTFLAARGMNIGASRYEQEFVDIAKDMLAESEKHGHALASIHLPSDGMAAAAPSEQADVSHIPLDDARKDSAIFDIGPETAKQYADLIASSGTVIWNGPVGMYEVASFASGSIAVADALADATAHGAISIIGGGDSIDFHHRYHVDLTGYTFVSTGGGAMLEYISGAVLPALEALRATA